MMSSYLLLLGATLQLAYGQAPDTTTVTTPAPTTTTAPIIANCVGCGDTGHIVGSANWCRCCSSQPTCVEANRENIYNQTSCIANDGFCTTTCLRGGIPDPQYCDPRTQPSTITAPATTTTTSAAPVVSTTGSSESVTTTSVAVETTPTTATDAPTTIANTTSVAATTSAAPTTTTTVAPTQGCVAITKPTGACLAPQGSLQHAGLSNLCQQIDDGNMGLPAEAQTCREECLTAATRLLCSLVCQKCVNNSTLVHNRACSDSCDLVDSACGIECAKYVYSQFGGRAGACGLVVSGCAPRIDHAILPVSEVDILIPGILVGLGVGLPLLCGLLILLFLRKQPRIEPHGEEEDGPSHWVGTVKPTPEAVAAADESIERGRRAKSAAHEDTSSLDFEDEDDEDGAKSKKKGADAKKGAKEADKKKGAKKESDEEEESYSYEYVTETLSGEDEDKKSDESEEEESTKEEEEEEEEESSDDDDDDDDEEEESKEETETEETEETEEEEEESEEEETEESESSEKPKKKSSKK